MPWWHAVSESYTLSHCPLVPCTSSIVDSTSKSTSKGWPPWEGPVSLMYHVGLCPQVHRYTVCIPLCTPRVAYGIMPLMVLMASIPSRYTLGPQIRWHHLRMTWSADHTITSGWHHGILSCGRGEQGSSGPLMEGIPMATPLRGYPMRGYP